MSVQHGALTVADAQMFVLLPLSNWELVQLRQSSMLTPSETLLPSGHDEAFSFKKFERNLAVVKQRNLRLGTLQCMKKWCQSGQQKLPDTDSHMNDSSTNN